MLSWFFIVYCWWVYVDHPAFDLRISVAIFALVLFMVLDREEKR